MSESPPSPQPPPPCAGEGEPTHQPASHHGHPRLAEALPALKRGGARFLVGGMLPVLTFYVGFRLGGAVVGILAGMTVSLTILAIQAYRTRRLDPIVVVPMLVILIQGGLALMTGSIDLYLAAPAVEAVIWGIVLVGSVAFRRPLVPLIARELGVVPARFATSVGMQRSLTLLTLAWGIAAFAKAVLRLWLLTLLPLEAFLIAVTVGITSINVVMIGLSVWLPLVMVRRQPHSQSI
ncbi:MAG: VC0807 family protein [Chloroflexota bacterium]